MRNPRSWALRVPDLSVLSSGDLIEGNGHERQFIADEGLVVSCRLHATSFVLVLPFCVNCFEFDFQDIIFSSFYGQNLQMTFRPANTAELVAFPNPRCCDSVAMT